MKTAEATPIEKIRSELRATVPEGIPATIKKFKSYLAEGSESYRLVIELEARFNAVNKQRFRDVISDDEMRREYNRIRVDLMDLIDQLSPENMATAKPQHAPSDSGTGCILYKIPHKMELQKLTRCVIRVAKEEDIIIENIELDKNVKVKPVRISDVMQVALLDPSEEYFEVRSVNDPVQIVYPSDYTQWIFYVKPLKPGSHPLMLKVSVIELVHGKERKHELVFEEQIEILAEIPEVIEEEPFRPAHFTFTLDGKTKTTTHRQLVPAHLVAKVQRHAAALLGLVTTAAMAMVLWQYLAKPKPPTPHELEDDPPTEVVRHGRIPAPDEEEKKQWEAITCDTCNTCKNRQAVLDFLKIYPRSIFQRSAKLILHECEMEDLENREKRKRSTIDTLAKRPQNRITPDDQEIDILIPKGGGPFIDPADQARWNYASEHDTRFSYSTYLRYDGRKYFDKLAKLRLKELEAQETPDASRGTRQGSDMVLVEGSTFDQGCTPEQGPDCASMEKPAHPVREMDFYIDRHEVTNEQYAAFLNAYGSTYIRHGHFTGKIMVSEHPWGIRYKRGKWMPQRGFEKHPVVNVTWFGANEYARFYGLRLPTEAEWEYAARGGTKSDTYKFAGSNDPTAVAWYAGNAGKKTHPVGTKKANELGLYDLSGNVKEWCLDDMRTYPPLPPAPEEPEALVNPRGGAYDFKRAIRGGSWKTEVGDCRVSARKFLNASFRYDDYGFRCVRAVKLD